LAQKVLEAVEINRWLRVEPFKVDVHHIHVLRICEQAHREKTLAGKAHTSSLPDSSSSFCLRLSDASGSSSGSLSDFRFAIV
jgi:hypothetical protein